MGIQGEAKSKICQSTVTSLDSRDDILHPMTHPCRAGAGLVHLLTR
jgi:hypothetical protein